MIPSRKRIARWSAVVEVAVVALAVPLLLFPAYWPAGTAGVLSFLVCAWVVRWIATGRPGVPTPLDLPLLLLGAMVPVAVWASAYPTVTLPKLTSLILGIATFRAAIDVAGSPRRLGVVTAVFLVLGLCVAAVGLVGTTWPEKLLRPELRWIQIPQRVQALLPGVEAGIHPNELAGTLLLFLPVALSAGLSQSHRRGWSVSAVRLAALLLAAFLGAVLLLAQSRSAWLGLLVGLGVMACLRWRWVSWLLLGAVLLLLLGVWFVGPMDVAQLFFPAATTSGNAGTMLAGVDLQERVEIWSHAVAAVQDFPFTGCGLGTFRRVVHILYPLFYFPPGGDVGHAHNLFLQVALDLGLPGLVAYLAMVGIAFWIAWRVAWSEVRHPLRWLAPGIVGSLVAFHVYGLTDAVTLGAKPGVAFWILLALAAGLWTCMEGEEGDPAGSLQASGAQGL